MVLNRILPILATFFSIPSGSIAAEEKHCSLIEGEAERSACYAQSPEASKSKSSKDWLVAISKAADSVVVVRSASRDVMCADKVGTFSLALMCKEDRTSLYISAGCRLGDTGDGRAISVRIDDQSPSEETLTVPNNKFVLSLDDEADAIRFMKSLLGRERLDIGITPPSQPQFIATFELADLEQKIKPLREACSW